MAQFDLTQNIEFEAGQEAQLHIENVEPTDVMTGDRNRKRFLYYQLKMSMQIRLLTGNYLGITQPSALFLIKRELGDRIDLRFYNDKERSFHPKAYIFHYENGG